MSARSQRDDAGRAFVLWSRLLLLAGSLLFALAIGELVARWSGLDPHPARKYRFHPRYGWTMEPDYWAVLDLPPSGFRTPAGSESGAGDGPRLLLLGDSFTAAVEHRWEDTFAGILAAEMAARGGALESLASGGWGTAQEYLALRHEGLAWRPDAVVLQVFPYNDVCNNGIEMAWTCSWQDHLRPYFVTTPGGLRQTWLHPVRARARSVSRLFGLIDRVAWKLRVGPLGESAREFNQLTREFTRNQARRIGLEDRGQIYALVPDAAQPPPVRQAWEATEALFAAVRRELDERGLPMLAVVIPFARSFDPEWTGFRRRRAIEMELDHDTRRAEAALARLGVPVVSVRRRIDANGLAPEELFNRSNHHLSVEGHRWTARWLLEELERQRALDGSPATPDAVRGSRVGA